MQKNRRSKKIETRYLSTKFVLLVRVMVGAYLLYTSYSLIDGVVNGEGRDKYLLGAFMIAFTIIGILLMLFAGRDLLQGKYVGGEMDAGEEAESETKPESAEKTLESKAEPESTGEAPKSGTKSGSAGEAAKNEPKSESAEETPEGEIKSERTN